MMETLRAFFAATAAEGRSMAAAGSVVTHR